MPRGPVVEMEAKRRKVDYSDCTPTVQCIQDSMEVDSNGSRLGSLPVEIVFKICRFLDSRDKMSLRLVSKSFYTALSDPCLWKEVNVTPNHCGNDKYVRNILKLSHTLVHTLQLHGKIPFSSKYVHNVTSCNALRRLSLCGFKITDLAMTKIQTALPNLTHFEGQFKSFEKHLTGFSSLQHLIVHLDKKNNFFVKWADCNFRPPYVAVFQDGFMSTYSLHSSDHHAILSSYCSNQRRPIFISCQHPKCNYEFGVPQLIAKVDCHESPLMSIQQVVSSRLLDSNSYIQGHVVAGNSHDAIPTVVYSEHGANITSLDLGRCPLAITFLEDVLSQTPNLIELNCPYTKLIGFDGKRLSVNEAVRLLPINCKRLQGLNIRHDAYQCIEDLWNSLANISTLKYLGTSPCAFLPLVKKSSIESIAISDHLKTMKISALQVFPNSHAYGCAKCENSLLQQSMLSMIANLSCLRYLNLHIPSSFRMCSLQEVLNGCKVLEELIVITKGYTVLVLPEDKGIYSTLKCLTLLCGRSVNFTSGFFTSLAHEDGCNNNLKKLVLVGNEIPLSGVYYVLNNCTQLLKCHITFRTTDMYFNKTRKLRMKQGLTDLTIEQRYIPLCVDIVSRCERMFWEQ